MRRLFREVLPSMFHRRLALLAMLVGVVFAVLSVQLGRLTIVEGAQWRGRAESVLERTRLVPTSRGTIFDARMRPLAVQRPADEVAVQYAAITGEWAYRQARRSAWRANRSRWGELGHPEREALTADYLPPFEQQVEDLWRALCHIAGMPRPDLERRKDVIVRRVQRIASDVWRRDFEQKLADGQEVDFSDVTRPISEQRDAHPLLGDLDSSQVLRIKSLIAGAQDDERDGKPNVWSQVQVNPTRRRGYPLETMTVLVDRSSFPGPLRADRVDEVTVRGVGLHILGQMRDAWKEDLDRRPYRRRDASGEVQVDLAGYLPGDRAGSGGVEESQEDRLRGTRGRVVELLDRDEQQRTEPRPGGDVVLTIDAQLQARVQAIMDPRLGLMRVQPWQSKAPAAPLGMPLNGAAVVLDVTQSQVLAAVTVPTFGLQQLEEHPRTIWRDKLNQPWVNRAVARPYAPGSTLKPLVLAASVTAGEHAAGRAIQCTGHLNPDDPEHYRCWIYKQYNSTHGPMHGAEAIQHSCNIFFYTLGRRMGPERLVRWYQRFGFGHAPGCGLPEEVAGMLPDLDLAGRPNAPGFSSYDGIFMGIGQGPVSVTPLQLAGAYAALARGGYYISPTFLVVPGRERQTQSSYDLGLNPAGVAMALRGLDLGVNDRQGTSHHIAMLDREKVFNIQGVKVMGKSGTATAAPLWVDDNGDGRVDKGEIKRRGDHAWFVGLAQREGSPRADYVVAVVVEYGGSGGATAGPITNQILYALRAEGYL